MFNKNDHYEPVYQFLSGSFHQDIEDPDTALEELLEEESTEYLKKSLIFLTDFINSSDLTLKEKSDYIEDATFIHFPSMEQSPLDWLRSVVKEIENQIN